MTTVDFESSAADEADRSEPSTLHYDLFLSYSRVDLEIADKNS